MSPVNLDNITRVAIAVVESDGEYLVGVRGPDGPLPGYHEFPGGKLNHGESPRDGAVRECREETGLDVSAFETLYECRHVYPHGQVELTFVLCRPIEEGRPPALGRFEWRTAAELSGLRFPEANGPVLSRIQQRQH
ncbi:MAG TPA: (deoxy)nucleoside triphosphate pyrophosphohydrolase [Caulifigura sp.]|jgi:8-oxo-dGTP diphosphatase|nr:(deoxy)nucleoside triphosphate pyrophosphohydrolase [Caulifigura sp.]